MRQKKKRKKISHAGYFHWVRPLKNQEGNNVPGRRFLGGLERAHHCFSATVKCIHNFKHALGIVVLPCNKLSSGLSHFRHLSHRGWICKCNCFWSNSTGNFIHSSWEKCFPLLIKLKQALANVNGFPWNLLKRSYTGTKCLQNPGGYYGFKELVLLGF